MQYLLNACTRAPWNMAMDQWVLENLETDEPVFWLWQNAPSVIIGLNQSASAEVNLPYLKEHGIALARRVTGGGAVYHDLGNLNYSFVGASSLLADVPARMEAALRALGAPVQRSGRNDLLVEGRKCSGYAKRFYKERSLVHGTLMWDVNLERLTAALAVPGSKLSQAGVASVRSRVGNLRPYLPFGSVAEFKAALQELLADGDEAIGLPEKALEEIDRLEAEKFGTRQWVIGHSPAASFSATKKFPCGSVTAHFTLKGGRFSGLQFTGDFIGERPAEELSKKLIGKSAEELLQEDVSRWFDGLKAEELMTLFQ